MGIGYRVELLGGFAVRAEDGQVFTRFRSRQTASLLAYMAYYPGKIHSRDVLADMFWPDAASSEKARLSLSVALSSLRALLEKPPIPPDTVFQATNAGLGTQPGAIITDVQEFESLLAMECWEEAVDAYTGPLLPGFYDDWVLPQQTYLRDRYYQTVTSLIQQSEQKGDIEGALRWLRLTVQGDPSDRDALDALMKALRNAGREEEAARTFYAIERRLRDEFGTAISPGLLTDHADLLTRFPDPSQRKRGRPRRPGGVSEPAGGIPITPLEYTSNQYSAESEALPLMLTRTIGRDREIGELKARFEVTDGPRLITLTGMTGVGKTQLAVTLAYRLQESGMRVLFVPLLTLRSEDQVLSRIAAAIGVQATDAGAVLITLARELDREPTLLILDNFEQLIETKSASIVGQLLARAASLRCLVTSQKRLPIPGEEAIPVLPLAAPPEFEGQWISTATEEVLSRYPAMALFVERARNVLPGFELTESNRKSIGDLVRALNGVPLAIELAAARMNILTPEEIRATLMERIGLLSSSRIDPQDRHHSLSASLQWSYDLLPLPARQLFRRLSVFRGGFAAADVAEVADEPLAFDYLALLSDASLVHSSLAPQGIRLTLLDIVRLFAAEQLVGNEKTETERRHALFFTERAVLAQQAWRTDREAAWLERLFVDRDNLSAVCHLLRAQKDSDALLLSYRMGRALNHYWAMRGSPQEGIEFLRGILQKPRGDPSRQEAALIGLCISSMNALGTLLYRQRMLEEADDWFMEATKLIAETRVSNPKAGVSVLDRQQAGIQMNQALVAQQRKEFDRARHLLNEALEYFRRKDDADMVGLILLNLGSLALDEGDLKETLQYSEEGRALLSARGDYSSMGHSYLNDGEVYLRQGDYPAAETAWREALVIFSKNHALERVSFSLLCLSVLLRARRLTDIADSLWSVCWIYRLLCRFPLHDFERPPYNLTTPTLPNPMPSRAEAESRLTHIVDVVLNLPSAL